MNQPLHVSAYDIAASTLMGAAVGFSVWGVFGPPVIVAGCAGAIAFVRVFSGLARMRSRPARLPLFTPAPLEFEHGDELLLDNAIERGDGPVVRLIRPLPTPGELHETIERHLDSRQPADATEELREALTQLRRSVA